MTAPPSRAQALGYTLITGSALRQRGSMRNTINGRCWVTLCATVDVQTERHSALAMSRSRLLKEAYHGPCHGAPFCEHCSLKGEPPKYNVPHVYHVPSKSLAHVLTPPLLSM